MSSKKHIKGIIALVMAAVFSFTMLTACGSTSQNTNTNQATTATASTTSGSGDQKLIEFAQKSLDYYFFIICQEGLKRAVESKGWKFESSVANFDSAQQTNQFINSIAKKPAAIISDPIDSEGLIDAINKARQANIPVGIFDTPTTGGDVAVTVAFDNTLAGKQAAEQIVKRLKEKYGVEKGTVLDVYGAMSSSAWRQRKEGFDAVMKQYPNIKVIDAPGEGDMAKSHDATVNAFAKNPNIDAVHCPSDTPARGLAEALQQNNKWKKVGEAGHVIFVTIDGEPVAVKNIKDGYYDATIVQDAISYGEITIELMDKYTFNGKEVPLGEYTNNKYFWKTAKIVKGDAGPSVVIPPYVMDSSNVTDPRHWGSIAENQWGIKYN